MALRVYVGVAADEDGAKIRGSGQNLARNPKTINTKLEKPKNFMVCSRLFFQRYLNSPDVFGILYPD